MESPHAYGCDLSNVNRSPHVFHLRDMQLLHHWNFVTSRSIVNTPDLDHVWQSLFPEIAFKNSYVVHGLLSLTALHLAHLKPAKRRSSINDAIWHHTIAIEGFYKAIPHISPENSDALFVSAILSFFYAFLTIGDLHDDSDEQQRGISQESRILLASWMRLLRGIEAVLAPVYENLRFGPLITLFSLGNWNEIEPDRVTSTDKQLASIRQIWEDEKHVEVYDICLFLLRKTWAWMEQFQNSATSSKTGCGYNRAWSGPFMWVFFVPEEYFDLQRQRQPAALIILAYYGALLQQLDEYWWAKGSGKSIVSAVDNALGPFWAPWTLWPKGIVGLV